MKAIRKISVVMAAYNEKGNVEELAMRLNKVLKKLRVPFEIIYIIKGDDGSYESLLELRRRIKPIRVYRYEERGLGRAFKYGFKRISKNASHVVTLDADLNHMPEELPLFIEKYNETGANIIIGSRLVKGAKTCKRSFIKQVVSDFVNALCPIIYGLDVKDITSGYRFLEAGAAKRIGQELESQNFEFLPEFLMRAKKMGYKVAEVPIKFQPRIRGKSKMSMFQTGFGYLKLTLKLFSIRYL